MSSGTTGPQLPFGAILSGSQAQALPVIPLSAPRPCKPLPPQESLQLLREVHSVRAAQASVVKHSRHPKRAHETFTGCTSFVTRQSCCLRHLGLCKLKVPAVVGPSKHSGAKEKGEAGHLWCCTTGVQCFVLCVTCMSVWSGCCKWTYGNPDSRRPLWDSTRLRQSVLCSAPPRATQSRRMTIPVPDPP